MKRHSLSAWLMLLALLFAFSACGGGGASSSTDEAADEDDSLNAADDDAASDDDAVTDDDVTTDDDVVADDDVASDDDTGDDDVFDPQYLTMQAYDVGLGDAVLFEIPGPYTMLVDGGSVGEGAYSICNDLIERGIERIDVMVLTHPHYDHCGGLTEIFACADVGEVWINGEESEHEAFLLFAEGVDTWGGAVVIKERGDVDTLGGATISTLGAYEGYPDVDDNSLVQMVEYEGWRVLMTGDITETAQQAMADDNAAALACDVVKIPDHGMGPASQSFIDALGASIGVLSVGGNELGYPTEDVVNAYLATDLDLYRTDEQGNVRLTFGESAISATTEE